MRNRFCLVCFRSFWSEKVGRKFRRINWAEILSRTIRTQSLKTKIPNNLRLKFGNNNNNVNNNKRIEIKLKWEYVRTKVTLMKKKLSLEVHLILEYKTKYSVGIFKIEFNKERKKERLNKFLFLRLVSHRCLHSILVQSSPTNRIL